MKAIRIQRKRTKGWKMPENTVYVGRPTKWGNTFCVKAWGAVTAKRAYRSLLIGDGRYISYHFDKAWVLKHLPELRGKNLACWCKLSTPCHADVLLELANK